MAATDKNATVNKFPIKILPKPSPMAMIAPSSNKINSIVYQVNNQQLCKSVATKPVKIILENLNDDGHSGQIPVKGTVPKMVLTNAQVLQNNAILDSGNQVKNHLTHRIVPLRILGNNSEISRNTGLLISQNAVRITKHSRIPEKTNSIEVEENSSEPGKQIPHIIYLPVNEPNLVIPDNWEENDSMHDIYSKSNGEESNQTTVKIELDQDETSSNLPENTLPPGFRLVDIVTQVSEYPHVIIDTKTSELINEQAILDAIEELKRLDEPMEIHEHIINISMKLVGTYIDDTNKTLSSFLLNDRDLKAFTGITVDTLTRLLRIPVDLKNFYSEDLFTFKCNVILCLCKLRLNLSFSCLQVLFKLKRTQTCKDIFHNMIKILAKHLGKSIKWPEKHQVLRDMPGCFIHFPSTRVVLSTLELELDEESWHDSYMICEKDQRTRKNLRAMLGLTPSGKVSYVGLVYAGHFSEEKIFVDSGLLERLIPHVDAVMVSKGYLIDVECTLRGVKLFHPPRLGAQKKYCLNDLATAQNMTQSLECVDKTLRHIRSFKILKMPVVWSLAPYLNEIVLSVAGLVNFVL